MKRFAFWLAVRPHVRVSVRNFSSFPILFFFVRRSVKVLDFRIMINEDDSVILCDCVGIGVDFSGQNKK